MNKLVYSANFSPILFSVVFLQVNTLYSALIQTTVFLSVRLNHLSANEIGQQLPPSRHYLKTIFDVRNCIKASSGTHGRWLTTMNV
jgi:hypothetical protein